MIQNEKWQIYELQAEVIKAVAHPIRLAIVEFLKDGEQCVCEIADHLRSKRSNISRHLALMLTAGILQCRKEGQNIYYTLKTPCLTNFLGCVNQMLMEKMQNSIKTLQNIAD